VPKKILLLDVLPRTPTGKMQSGKIAELARLAGILG